MVALYDGWPGMVSVLKVERRRHQREASSMTAIVLIVGQFHNSPQSGIKAKVKLISAHLCLIKMRPSLQSTVAPGTEDPI